MLATLLLTLASYQPHWQSGIDLPIYPVTRKRLSKPPSIFYWFIRTKHIDQHLCWLILNCKNGRGFKIMFSISRGACSPDLRTLTAQPLKIQDFSSWEKSEWAPIDANNCWQIFKVQWTFNEQCTNVWGLLAPLLIVIIVIITTTRELVNIPALLISLWDCQVFCGYEHVVSLKVSERSVGEDNPAAKSRKIHLWARGLDFLLLNNRLIYSYLGFPVCCRGLGRRVSE